MAKYKVFPEGYDPMMALGPPNQQLEKDGITWTPEDTERCAKLEKLAIITSSKPPDGRWYEEVDE